jgi:hypothetical protein
LITYDTFNIESNSKKFSRRSIIKFKKIETNKQNIVLLQYTVYKVIHTFLFVARLGGKNMAKIIKFVYLVIFFIFLLVVVTNVTGKQFL